MYTVSDFLRQSRAKLLHHQRIRSAFMTLRNAETPSPTSDEIVSDIQSVKPHSIILFALVVVLFMAARLWRLTASCLWFDEIFSVHATRHGLRDLMHFVAADIIHPPLFYLLLKFWIVIGGESLFWLRLLPALLSILAIVPFVLLCRELNRTATETNLALLLMAINGYLIKYAQEVRMYSLLFLLSLCSLWLFVRFMKTGPTLRKTLLALAGINLLLVYTHYSGWLIVVLQAVALSIWERSKLKVFLMSVVGLLLTYLPWLYEIAKTAREPGRDLAQNIGWVTRPNLQDILQYFTLLSKPFVFSQSNIDLSNDALSIVLSLLLFVLPIVLFSSRLCRSGQAAPPTTLKLLRTLLFFSLAPCIFLLFFSWILPYSIWGTRHLIMAAAPYFLITAVSWTHLRHYWSRIAVIIVFGCWSLLAGTLLLLRQPPVFIWCAWEQLVQRVAPLEPISADAVPVYAFEDLVAYHLWFSLETSHPGRFKVSAIKGVPGLVEDPAYFLPRGFTDITTGTRSNLEGDRIWVAFRDTHWSETRPPINFLKAMGYRVATIQSLKAQGQEAFLVQLTRN